MGSPPVGEQDQKVRDAHRAVAVQIGGARFRRIWTRAPRREQGEQIGDAHGSVAVEIADGARAQTKTYCAPTAGAAQTQATNMARMDFLMGMANWRIAVSSP